MTGPRVELRHRTIENQPPDWDALRFAAVTVVGSKPVAVVRGLSRPRWRGWRLSAEGDGWRVDATGPLEQAKSDLRRAIRTVLAGPLFGTGARAQVQWRGR